MRMYATVCDLAKLDANSRFRVFELHLIAYIETARCVLYGYGQARPRPTPPLIRLRLNGILLCEAQPLPRLRAEKEQQEHKT